MSSVRVRVCLAMQECVALFGRLRWYLYEFEFNVTRYGGSDQVSGRRQNFKLHVKFKFQKKIVALSCIYLDYVFVYRFVDAAFPHFGGEADRIWQLTPLICGRTGPWECFTSNLVSDTPKLMPQTYGLFF